MKKKVIMMGIVAVFAIICLMGCKTDDSDPETKVSEVGFTLTVTNLPTAETGKIYGASLLGQNSQPIAIGMELSVAGVFTFYHPTAQSMPDSSRPFNTAGSYTLAIALTNLQNPTSPEKIYNYTGGTSAGTVTYSDTIKTLTVAWADFSEMGGQPSAQSTVITITNKPSNAGVLAVTEGNTQKALGLNMSGNIFTLYEPGQMGPDTSKPWNGTGNYSIFLINITTQAPVATYMKMEGGTPNTLYSFTGQAAITLDYATDFVPVP